MSERDMDKGTKHNRRQPNTPSGRYTPSIRATLTAVIHIVVAIVCFGPIAIVALLGLIAVPMWLMMLDFAQAGAVELADAERWDIVRSIGLVFGALIGLVGLLWVVFLSVTGWKPKGMRHVTRILVGTGLLTLIGFNVTTPVLLHPIEAFGALLMYLVLPAVGSVYFLHQQRDYIGFSITRSSGHRLRQQECSRRSAA